MPGSPTVEEHTTENGNKEIRKSRNSLLHGNLLTTGCCKTDVDNLRKTFNVEKLLPNKSLEKTSAKTLKLSRKFSESLLNTLLLNKFEF